MKLYLVLSGESDMHRSCGPRLKAGEDAHAQRPPRNSLRPAPLHYRMLASYWYFKSLNFDRSLPKFYTKPYPNIFADCGAFSAHQQRQVIEVAEYADWLHRWRHLFDAYANLDVIGSAEDTLRNQRYLEGRGLAPVPVFHAGDPWSVLEELLAEHPYIALGGMVG